MAKKKKRTREKLFFDKRTGGMFDGMLNSMKKVFKSKKFKRGY